MAADVTLEVGETTSAERKCGYAIALVNDMELSGPSPF